MTTVLYKKRRRKKMPDRLLITPEEIALYNHMGANLLKKSERLDPHILRSQQAELRGLIGGRFYNQLIKSMLIDTATLGTGVTYDAEKAELTLTVNVGATTSQDIFVAKFNYLVNIRYRAVAKWTTKAKTAAAVATTAPTVEPRAEDANPVVWYTQTAFPISEVETTEEFEFREELEGASEFGDAGALNLNVTIDNQDSVAHDFTVTISLLDMHGELGWLFNGADYNNLDGLYYYNGLYQLVAVYAYRRIIQNNNYHVNRGNVSKKLTDQSDLATDAETNQKGRDARGDAGRIEHETLDFLDRNRNLYPQWNLGVRRGKGLVSSFRISKV